MEWRHIISPSFILIVDYKHIYSWWFQPIWKILVKLDHFPKDRGEHLKQNETTRYLAILCDLFGMVKWPFQRLSDLQLGDKKVTLNHLVVIQMQRLPFLPGDSPPNLLSKLHKRNTHTTWRPSPPPTSSKDFTQLLTWSTPLSWCCLKTNDNGNLLMKLLFLRISNKNCPKMMIS